MQIYSVDAK